MKICAYYITPDIKLCRVARFTTDCFRVFCMIWLLSLSEFPLHYICSLLNNTSNNPRDFLWCIYFNFLYSNFVSLIGHVKRLANTKRNILQYRRRCHLSVLRILGRPGAQARPTPSPAALPSSIAIRPKRTEAPRPHWAEEGLPHPRRAGPIYTRGRLRISLERRPPLAPSTGLRHSRGHLQMIVATVTPPSARPRRPQRPRIRTEVPSRDILGKFSLCSAVRPDLLCEHHSKIGPPGVPLFCLWIFEQLVRLLKRLFWRWWPLKRRIKSTMILDFFTTPLAFSNCFKKRGLAFKRSLVG